MQEALDIERKCVAGGVGDSNIPMVFIRDREGKMTLVALAVPKTQYATIAAATTALMGTDEFVFVMSAWASTDYVPGRMPRDDPNRKHARILSYCKRGEPTRMWQLFYMLTTDKSESPSTWEEWTMGEIEDRLMGNVWRIRDEVDRDPARFAAMMRKMK